MEFDEFKQNLIQRYSELSDNEKEMVRKFRGTKQGMLLSNLLGPEMQSLLSRLAAPSPKKKGLAEKR